MRKANLLLTLASALVPTFAALNAVALTPVSFPAPIPTTLPIAPILIAPAPPPLATGAIVGALQSVPVSECAAWTAQACTAAAPTLSSDGTTGTCVDGTYLHCCPSQASICAPWLTTLYDQTYNANVTTNTAGFVVPVSLASGNVSANGLGYTKAQAVAANVGTGSSVLGNQMQFFTTTQYVPATDGSLTQLLTTAQSAYSTQYDWPRYTGQGVNSCDEYVWKKWQGYARWEDAARAGASDPIWVTLGSFDALDPAPTRSDGMPLFYNGTLWAYQHNAGDTIPRNAFFSFVPSWLSSSDPTQAAILASLQYEQAHPFVLGAAGSSNIPGAIPNDLEWVSNCTAGGDACGAISGNGRPWQWSTVYYPPPPPKNPPPRPTIVKPQTIVEHQVGIPEQVTDMQIYASNQARMDAYAGLLSQLADLRVQMVGIERSLGAYQSSGGHTTQSTIPIVYPAISAPLLNGSPTPSSATPTPAFSSYYFPHTQAKRAAAVAYLTQAMTLPVTQWPAGVAPKPTPPSGDATTVALETQLNAVIAQVATTQQQITQALESEWNAPTKGCLLGLTDQQYANSCDWSPQAFVQSYMGMFEAQRQTALNRCIADTGNKFPVASATAFVNPVWQGSAQWMDSLTDFEAYLSIYEQRDALNAQYKAMLAATQQTYMNQTTSVPVVGNGCAGANHGGNTSSSCSGKVGQSGGDTFGFGGSYFGASVSYGAGWSATMIPQPVSATVKAGNQLIGSMDADINGKLNGNVTVFGSKQTILDVALDVATKPGAVTVNQAHFTALGKNYYTGPEGQSFTKDQELDFAFDETPLQAGFSVIIPILCVPVKISADLALHVGLDGKAVVKVPPVTPDPNNLAVSLNGSLTPYASVDADVQVGVDLLIISAGIEGELTLINASLPINESLSLGNASNGEITLNSNTSVNLSLNELAGHIDLYAEVDLLVWSDKATFYLANWDGFHQNVALFKPLALSWPIDAIDYRLFGQTNPNDVGK